MKLFCPSALTEEFNIIDGCSFNFNYPSIANDGQNNSHITNAIFRGKNYLNHLLNDAPSNDLIYISNCILEGNDDACNPNEIVVNGQTQFCVEVAGIVGLNHGEFKLGRKPSGASDGYAKIEFKQGSLFTIYAKEDIEINENAAIIIDDSASLNCVKKDAVVAASSDFVNFNLKGKFIAKNNSFIQKQNGYISSNNSSNSLLFISSTCNFSNTTLSNNWGGGFVPNWKGNYPAPISVGQSVPCITGGHTSFASDPQCSAAFSNISTNGSFNILYNLIPNDSQFDFTFQPEGGALNYNCILDGASVVNGGTFTINAGAHALLVTDDNGCSSDFYFNTNGSLTIGCQERMPIGDNPTP